MSRKKATVRPRPLPEAAGPRHQHLLAFAWLLLAVILFYVGMGLFRLNDVCVPTCGWDRSLFMWMFAWMAKAVSTSQNPFFSPFIGAPAGVPLYWTTSVPTLALIGVPFTAIWGAQASYNILAAVGFALSAWAVYLLSMEVTQRYWPSLAGGGLFLLSPYMSKEAIHLNLLFVAPPILLLREIVRYARQRSSRTRFVGTGAALLVAEFFISTEIFATATFFGAIALVIHFMLDRDDWRDRAKRLLGGLAAAYGLCLLALVPVLLRTWQLRPQSLGFALEERSGQIAEWVIPGSTTALGSLTPAVRDLAGLETTAAVGGQGYLSLPLLLLCGHLWLRRADHSRLLLSFAMIAMLFSLGPAIRLAPGLEVPGPWAAFAWLPLLEHAWPVRFPVYAWISISVLCAVALSHGAIKVRRPAWAAVVSGALMLFPNTEVLAPPETVHPISRPPFFTAFVHRWFLDPSDTVLVLANVSTELEWQVASGFEFRLAEGYLGPYTAWGVPPLNWGSPLPANQTEFRELTSRLALDWVALPTLPTGHPNPWQPFLEGLTGLPPISVGGVDLYRISPVVNSAPTQPSAEDEATYEQGLEALERGDDEAALEAFGAMLEDTPMDPNAHLQLALIALRYKGSEDNRNLAVAHLRAALIADPDFVPALVALARIWSDDGLDAVSRSFFLRVVELQPAALTRDEIARAEKQMPATVTP